MKQVSSFLCILFLSLFLIQCDKDSGTNPVDTPQEFVHMEYPGHSSFLMTTSDSLRIVTDPFGNSIQAYYNVPDSIVADYATVSHRHADHVNFKGIVGDPIKLMQADTTYQVGNMTIRGYLSSHGDLGASKMGSNIIFVYQLGDIKIVHLGENAMVADQTILDAISDADVMIIPTGQIASIKFEEIEELKALTHPKTIIPSHYSTNPENLYYYGTSTLEEFVDQLPVGTLVEYGDSLEITADMPEQVFCMNPQYAKE